MDPDTVYAKTEKGKERFEARNIPTSLRHALILVDGHSTVKDLLKKGEGLAHFQDSLEMLEQMGLMAPVGAATPTPLPAKLAISPGAGTPVKRQLVLLVKTMLGDKGDKIIRKIEETVDTNLALMATIDNCGRLIKLTIDEKKAEAFVHAAKEIMAKHT